MAKSTFSSAAANASVSTVNEIPNPISTNPTASKPRRTTGQTFTKARHKLKQPFRKAPPSFSQFPNLPTEIRLQIWEATLTGRVHELHPCAQLYHNRMTFRSNSSTTPSIFHVSRESRKIALKHYELMEYTPNPVNEDGSGTGKGILRFYFAPKLDTLLLNSLMGLFVMFMLLEGTHDPGNILSTGGSTAGVMKGWERVAIDAERAQLITLLSGIAGHSPQPRFKQLLPNLKELVVAFDYTSKGKTRFRTSVWPGENGTSLARIGIPRDMEAEWATILAGCVEPLKGFLINDYKERKMVVSEGDEEKGSATEEEEEEDEDESERGALGKDGVPLISVAKVQRKRFIRGDLRYAFRWSCSLVGLRPRGIFRRL